MKSIRLRSYKDGLGTTIEVEAYFSQLPGQSLLDRLIQVAEAIKAHLHPLRLDGAPDHAACLITGIDLDFGAGHVVVSAGVPEAKTAELVQRELLAMLLTPAGHDRGGAAPGTLGAAPDPGGRDDAFIPASAHRPGPFIG